MREANGVSSSTALAVAAGTATDKSVLADVTIGDQVINGRWELKTRPQESGEHRTIGGLSYGARAVGVWCTVARGYPRPHERARLRGTISEQPIIVVPSEGSTGTTSIHALARCCLLHL